MKRPGGPLWLWTVVGGVGGLVRLEDASTRRSDRVLWPA